MYLYTPRGLDDRVGLMMSVMVVINPKAEVWISGNMAGQTVVLSSRAATEWVGETIYIS